MTKISRRGALCGGFAGMIVAASPSQAQPVLQAPAGLMRLTRTLIRGLSDGNQIEVTRVWQISFTRHGQGLAVEGRQSSVSVQAPERLEPIAAIERNRSTDGKFPILIDSTGLIVSAGEAEHASDVDRAIRVAQEMADSNGASIDRQKQLLDALSQVQAAGNTLLDRLPRDLFFPRNESFFDRRDIELPDGSKGEFEVRYIASTQPISRLLDRADRYVVTRIGGSEQSSSESWELQPI